MKRTRRLILSCLLLSLLLLTACGQRETVYQISADRLTQAATVSQLQEVSDLIVVFTRKLRKTSFPATATATSPPAIPGPPAGCPRC